MALNRKKQTNRLIHRVIGVLAQHFRGGQYDTGWDDVRVAKETDVSKLFVAETRQWRLAPSIVRASGSGLGSPVAVKVEAEVTAE